MHFQVLDQQARAPGIKVGTALGKMFPSLVNIIARHVKTLALHVLRVDLRR